MHALGLFALAALAVPVIAAAQVGPNPTVPNGSLSPSVGGSPDVMTAPQDTQIGGRASGNVIDRTIDTRANAGADAATPDAATPDAATDGDAAAGGTGTTVGTETRTRTGTSGMEPSRRGR